MHCMQTLGRACAPLCMHINRLRDQFNCTYATPVTCEEHDSTDAMMGGFLMDFMKMEPNF